MKSVCQIVQGVYDIDPRVRRKAEALVAAGYTVDVLALRAEGGNKRYRLQGVNVRTLALGKKRGSLARYLFEYTAFFSWAMLRASLDMLRNRYAVIEVNTLPDFLIFAPFLAKLMGAKLVLDMHEITPEFYMSKYGIGENSRTIRLLTYLEKVSMRFADHVLTINAPIQDLLVSRGLDRSKSTIIMNVADEARFAGSPETSSNLPKRDPQKFVMIYHGTLTHIYGLDIAIEAFALVQGKMPGAELNIIGSGTEKDALAKLAEERGVASKVKLIGQIKAHEIPDRLRQCDAGILPMRQDVFFDYASPNKLGEFIIMGKPVIVSRLRAILHYFSENALAYAEPNNAEALAKQMVRLYRDRELCARLASRAKEEYAPIRWDVMKERYLKRIGDLIDISQLNRATVTEGELIP